MAIFSSYVSLLEGNRNRNHIYNWIVIEILFDNDNIGESDSSHIELHLYL